MLIIASGVRTIVCGLQSMKSKLILCNLNFNNCGEEPGERAYNRRRDTRLLACEQRQLEGGLEGCRDGLVRRTVTQQHLAQHPLHADAPSA